jgi:hypothetical protein
MDGLEWIRNSEEGRGKEEAKQSFTCMPLKKMVLTSVPLKKFLAPVCHRPKLICPLCHSVQICK